MRILTVLVILLLAFLSACTPKEVVNTSEEAPVVEEISAAPDTLSYDFLSEGDRYAGETSAEAQADLPPLAPVFEPVVEEPELPEETEETVSIADPPMEIQEEISPVAVEEKTEELFWVQLFASSSKEKALAMARSAESKLQGPVRVFFLDPHYKVLTGGFAEKEEALKLRAELVTRGYPDAWIFHP
ncbi:MAG: SPOR domain-containing protein [Candidatus Krumholzibacteria bacterium]|nr:SPOR domain-containing protein [Candidatus Krumholzibacteria bacterium]MDP6669490.1 SPOR domain-containing protein [Candidatus Krumholzibacteria bacterium]MDP6796355.1 SPOR domain-containing protein [Candidatus Krumholzibacteria bacterium]MDP7020851.1 SPOR domain-containing protein [Candidatus Krumholzibacteria bacterium]